MEPEGVQFKDVRLTEEGTYSFERDGSGTKLTVENDVRSFWRLPPLERLLDWVAAKTHQPRFARLKAMLEE